MKKLVFGITNLNLGGAERVLVDICNKLCDIYDITIFTIYGSGEFEKSLSSKIKLKSMYSYRFQDLSKIKKIIVPIKLFLLQNYIYKKHIKGDYDVEIAFLEGPVTSLFSHKNTASRKIAWIHNDISLVFGNGIKANLKKRIGKKIYQKYQDLIFVSHHNLEKFKTVYKEKMPEKRVIHNYVDKRNVIEKSKENIDFSFDKEYINFLSVARLVEQKGIQRLIDVHNNLIKDGYMHKIYIVGDGPLKEKLEEKIAKLKLQDTFILLGKRENPYPYMKHCDYFCLLSHYCNRYCIKRSIRKLFK